MANIVSVPQGDVAAVEERLSSGEFAAVILEPTGTSWGTEPLDPAFLSALREVTARTNSILIFDEVVTGFRVSPGGTQARHNVTPDVTTLAKILAGGMPGGAVCGRADIISIHLPKTAETLGLIGKDQLALTRKGVIIVNAARGGLVDEDALAEAVRSGHVGGAGIDVYVSEPTTSSPVTAVASSPSTARSSRASPSSWVNSTTATEPSSSGSCARSSAALVLS